MDNCLVSALNLILLSADVVSLEKSQALGLKVASLTDTLDQSAVRPLLSGLPVLVLDHVVPMAWVSVTVLILDKLLWSILDYKPGQFFIHWDSKYQRAIGFLLLLFGLDWLVKLRRRILFYLNEGDHLINFSIWAVAEADNLAMGSQGYAMLVDLCDPLVFGAMELYPAVATLLWLFSFLT